MDMTVKRVNVASFEEFFTETTQMLEADKRTSTLKVESQKHFLEARIKYLDTYVDELQEKQKKLEEGLVKDIQKLIADRGAEILSLKQIIKLTAKECGVCELALNELKEQGEHKSA